MHGKIVSSIAKTYKSVEILIICLHTAIFETI